MPMAPFQHCTAFFVLFVCASGFACTDDAKPAGQNKQAVQTATAWFNALLGGNVKEAAKVSGVPFSWDRKKLIAKPDELRSEYQRIAANVDKGIKVDSAKVAGKEEAKKLLPKHYLGKEKQVVLVIAKISGEGALIMLKPGKEMKVIGFSD